jgi:ATP-dependent protease ClpP protease subunit
VTDFVTKNCRISAERFTELMTQTDELIMDLGSCVDGETAVKEGLIDKIGSLGDALEYLYSEIEKSPHKQ